MVIAAYFAAGGWGQGVGLLGPASRNRSQRPMAIRYHCGCPAQNEVSLTITLNTLHQRHSSQHEHRLFPPMGALLEERTSESPAPNDTFILVGPGTDLT